MNPNHLKKMQNEKESQASFAGLFNEAKKYYGLQKQYLRYSAAEQLTKLISKIAIAAVVALLALIIFVFAGMALVHWLGSIINNMALCYALYALFLLLLLIVFYCNRRRWVILPLARMMTDIFIQDEKEDDEDED
ncbi:MAG: hypothetical protein MJZ60_00600 [Bacteroidaceae bacterium]|nr:hypothetical protein [Bacteroidaceae bacterium]